MEKRPRSGTSSQDAVPVPNETKKLKLASHSTGSPIRHSATRRTNKDYTVGWICAITTEYVAAKCFLDERHEVPDQVTTHDNNNYTLGMIGKHNVVIAALPFGEYGISSAASVARDMVHTFPNIRIGLMVGVGGGAPGPGHDIRLGDVVVGVSRAGKGSVCQYDFGEAIQGQGLKETAYLNQPPALLRTAVSGLIAQYQIEGHRIQEAIDNTLKRYPRLQKKYKRPESNTDRLYLAKIVHPLESNIQCTIHCGDDLSCFKDRPERGEDEDNPTIHFGLIASANTLMRDAIIRDAMVKEKGVLCFETEAAGLMNHFPCLVIRGICDYSDSHKNDEWQGYAAMTAAAYTADLLRLISPNKVEAERKISEILEGMLSARVP
jgi:nucleoside phosphorylase